MQEAEGWNEKHLSLTNPPRDWIIVRTDSFRECSLRYNGPDLLALGFKGHYGRGITSAGSKNANLLDHLKEAHGRQIHFRYRRCG